MTKTNAVFAVRRLKFPKEKFGHSVVGNVTLSKNPNGEKVMKNE